MKTEFANHVILIVLQCCHRIKSAEKSAFKFVSACYPNRSSIVGDFQAIIFGILGTKHIKYK